MSTPHVIMRSKRGTAIGLGLVVAAAVLFFGLALTSIALSDPARAFEQGYTQPGQCLAGTPFDPDKGAMMHEDTVNGIHVFVVIPVSANSYRPSALMFATERHAMSASLYPSDNVTEQFLTRARC